MNKMTIEVEMKDGTEHCVSVENPDQVRWDMYTSKHGYGSLADVPFLGQTYLAWCAMVRTGKYSGPFDAFSQHDCVGVISHSPDEDDAPDPTR